MFRHLSRRLQTAYSNIRLNTQSDRQAAFLTLANSKKRNPLSLATIREINAALGEVQQAVNTHKIKVLVMEGEGPAFSAGHDLKEIAASDNPSAIFNECTETLLKLKHLPIITLCAVNGVAAAAGLQMALTCDILLTTQNSSFSTPGVKWGLFCSTPGVQLIRSINSEKKAKEMLLYGESISAAQAHQYGLVNKVVAQDQLQAEIDGYIQRAHHLSGEVIALGKQAYEQQIVNSDLKEAYCVATKAMHQNIIEKQDCKQGLKAFAQKRHPQYKN